MRRLVRSLAVVSFACAALATVTGCSTVETKPQKEIGLQLYSLRSILRGHEDDANLFTETMNKLGEMGYTTVESASYQNGMIYGLTPDAYRQVIENAGMKAISAHVSHFLSPEEIASGDLTAALEWWKTCIADHKAAGCEYLVTPSMPRTPNQEEIDLYCRYYNEVGRLCKEQGIQYGYHNHSYEFKHKIGDDVMYDYLIQHTDPELVFFQMDVYWTVYGNASPVKYFQKYPGRFKGLHIKDYQELGQSGMVGFDAIFNHIDEAGTEFIIVELESSENENILDGVEESIDYLINAPFVPAIY